MDYETKPTLCFANVKKGTFPELQHYYNFFLKLQYVLALVFAKIN